MDYSDANMGGAPFHTIDCENLRIGQVDADTAPMPSHNANADDNSGFDDEKGVASPPSFAAGGPQNIAVTVDSVKNTTGQTANVYAWLNLNGDFRFQVGGGTVYNRCQWV
ncbi:MAG: hypothetical protein IPN15_16585 [Saprospiraceae bacterium]|nr:hypothetical protein [Candidatus Vicinibacter affinis]